MKLDKKGIPVPILNGKVRRYITVHNTYRANLIHQLMLRIHRSFWARAKGGSDDLGNTWKDLSPKTHAYKPLSPIEKGTYQIRGRLNRGLLTPAQDKIWGGIFAKTRRRLIKQGASATQTEKEAAEKAWGVVKKLGARTKLGLGRVTDINVRTGRLVAATRPGKVVGGRYYSPKDQRVTVNPRSVNIKFDIPYIADVNKVRPVVPDNINRWIQESHDIAIVQAKRVYDRIKATARNDRVTNQRSGHNQSGRNRRRSPPRR